MLSQRHTYASVVLSAGRDETSLQPTGRIVLNVKAAVLWANSVTCLLQFLGLHNDVISITQVIRHHQGNSKTIINDEIGRILKKAVVAYFILFSGIFTEGL